MRFLLFLALAIDVLLVTPAHAKSDSAVAILSIEISGDGAPELRKRLKVQIRNGLSKDGTKVVGLDETLEKLKSTPELISCSSTTCLEHISELTGAKRFVVAKVEARGAAYDIRLDLLTAEEEVTHSVSKSCAVCTIAELSEITLSAATSLLTDTPVALHSVLLVSTPLGASLTVDGLDVGSTPHTIELAAGSHRVVASMRGRIDGELEIEVKADSEAPQQFDLALIEAVEQQEVGRDFGYWKWVAAGGAVGAIALGSALIAIDDDPTCSSAVQKVSQCEDVYDTFVGGAVAISVGVIAGGASAWMFWSGRERAANGMATVQVTSDAALGVYSFHF